VQKVPHPFDEFLCDVRADAGSMVGRPAGELSVFERAGTESLVEGDG
jgi:hypothetical protein